MSSEDARLPGDSDWQTMNIFVFSNGQQYSPPRKYHLRIEDLDWWKSTLRLLARTQYGALHSNIELYTIEGKKIACPMELSDGACYVAVKPPDEFVDTGYEKYLIRASRSWEKRQSRTQSAVGPDVSNNNTEMENPTVEPNNQLREENLILKTILSSIHNETKPIVQPESELVVQDKHEPLRATAVKPMDRKRTSMPRPTVRNSNAPKPPTMYLKPSFKRNDSIRAANVKKTKPENAKYPSSCSGSNQPNKLPVKSKVYKAPNKLEESPEIPKAVLTKVHVTGSKLIASSTIKIINIDHDDGKLTIGNVNPENVVEDKEVDVISHFLQSPQKEALLASEHPIRIQREAKMYHADTENICENIRLENKKDNNPQKRGGELKNIASTSSEEVIKFLESPPVTYSIITNEQFDTRLTTLNVTNADKGKNMNNQVNNEINTNQDSPPRKQSIIIMTEMLSDNRCGSHNIDEHVNLSNVIKVTNQTRENNDNFKIPNSPPQRHSVMIMTDMCPSNQSASSCSSRNCKDERNNNDVEEKVTKANKNFQTHNITPELHETTDRSFNDQYVAVLNRGDYVNLKLNIEIKNHPVGLSKSNENTANLHSVNNVLATERGSHINIVNQLVAQNKSLLSMITKEINNHHIGDKHRMYTVQSGTCKYCNDRNVESSDDDKTNKNYLILLPVECFAENPKGCPCNVHDPHIQRSSSCQPVKATYSCMSLQRLTKLSQTDYTSDVKVDETTALGLNPLSEKGIIMVARKKSVAINEDSLTCTRQSSKICRSINQTDDSDCNQIAVNRDCPETSSKSIMDNSTQTEWCDVLLEAKHVENGHYTFRLPTLEMLKYYKLP